MLESEWEESINSSGVQGCRTIQAKLERLLDKTKARISSLEATEEQRALKYTGNDEIECGCGNINTVQSGGKHAVVCEECSGEEETTERCTECVEDCSACGKNLCDKHRVNCSGCDDFFCNDCLQECCSCQERYCDGSKDCSLVGIGYGGEASCIYCLER